MIAIFCPFHLRHDIAIDQINNYQALFSNNAMFFIHISVDARNSKLQEYQEIETRFENVVLIPFSNVTSSNCTFGAFLACTEYLLQSYEKSYFSHIYLHTDSNLLLKRGVDEYIIENNVGFGIGQSPMLEPHESKWFHATSMYGDSKFVNFIQAHKGIDIWVGRQEGSFFSVDLWLEIYNTSQFFYPWDEYINELENVWPLEEVLIPTICKSILNIDSNVRNVIQTKKQTASTKGQPLREIYGIADLDDFWSEPDPTIFGVKRFPLKVDCDARAYVRSKISKL